MCFILKYKVESLAESVLVVTHLLPWACPPPSPSVCGAAPAQIHSPASVKPGANESQKTLNKCLTRNKTVFHTRLRHPEMINSVPLNSVLRIKQTGV